MTENNYLKKENAVFNKIDSNFMDTLYFDYLIVTYA